MIIGLNKITMSKKQKIYSYPRSMFIEYNANSTFQYVTQLYEIGVYIIINNDSQLQFIFSPKDMEKFVKKMLKDDKIKSVDKGSIVNVQEVDGFFKEVEV
jgi:hypothetical protein